MSHTSSTGGNAISRFFHSSLERFDIWFYYQVWVLFAALFLKMGWNTIPQICTASILAFVLGYGLRWICQGSNVLANWIMRIKIIGMIAFWVFFLLWAMGDGGDWFHTFTFSGLGIAPYVWEPLNYNLPKLVSATATVQNWDYFWIDPASPPTWLPGSCQFWLEQTQGMQHAVCFLGMGYFVVKSLFFLVLNGAFYVDTFHGHARSHSAATVVDHHHACAHATQHHMTIFAHRNGARNAACDVATFVDVHPRGVVQRPCLEPLGEWAPRELVLQDTEKDVPDFHVKMCEIGYYSFRGMCPTPAVYGDYGNTFKVDGYAWEVVFAVNLALHHEPQHARNRWGKHILYRVNAALNAWTVRQLVLYQPQFNSGIIDVAHDDPLIAALAACGFEIGDREADDPANPNPNRPYHFLAVACTDVPKPPPPPKPAGGGKGGRGGHP